MSPSVYAPFRLLAIFCLGAVPAIKAVAALDLPALVATSGEWAEVEAGLWRGERGVALAPDAHADFSATVRLRLDDLRYQARIPQAGVAFAASGRRDHAGVVFDRNTGRLQLVHVVENRSRILAVSERHAILPLHEWVWLRVTRQGSRLTAALSSDGAVFDDYLRASLPAEIGAGRLGLIADLPAATFGPATPPALAWREAGSWVQTRDGAVEAEYVVETFDSEAGLRRAVRTVRFAPGANVAEVSGPAPVVLANPALAHHPAAGALAAAPGAFDDAPAPSLADYRRAFAAVAAALPRRDGYIRLGNVFAYDATRDPALRDALVADARELLAAFARDGRTPTGFSELYAAHRILLAARRDRLLGDSELVAARDFARRALLRAGYERGPMNRAIGLLAAIRPGLELSDGHPRADELRVVAAKVEADLAAVGFSPLEDSTNYQLISAFFILAWAGDAGRADVMADPRFRSVFENLLHQLAPDGSFPTYGDDHAGHPGMLLGLFEAAARAFGDGRYREAAARVYARHFASGVLPAGLVGEDALGLGLALVQVDEGLVPVPLAPPANPVLVFADGSPSKAVLVAGASASAIHVVLDLANGREHGHHDALAVAGLFAGGASLLPDAGRYARSAEFHPRPLATDAAADFPHRRDTREQSRRMLDDMLPPGAWRRLSFSVRQHWIWGNFAGDLGLPALERDQYHPDIGAEFSYDPARQSVLLLALSGVGPVTVETRAVRLTGPAGVRELTTFPARVDLVLGPETAYRGAVFPEPLDLKSPGHDRLDLELRLTPAAPGARVALNSLVLGDADGYPKRLVPADSPAERARVLFARNAPSGAVAGFEAVTTTPAGQAVRLTRLVAALPGRGVWVRDRFDSLAATSVAVGPVWRFASARLGADGWLHAPGLRVGLDSPDATLSARPVYGVETPLAFSAGALLGPGQAATRDTFLAPVSCPKAPARWTVRDGVLLLDDEPVAIHRLVDDGHELEVLP